MKFKTGDKLRVLNPTFQNVYKDRNVWIVDHIKTALFGNPSMYVCYLADAKQKVLFQFLESEVGSVMEQVTMENDKYIKSFGLSYHDHNVACNAILDKGYEDGYFITEPDNEMIQSWIEQGAENAQFLHEALETGATIYTLNHHIMGESYQSIGEFYVI